MAVQGLEAGILVGVVLCSLHFAYEYSLMQLVTFTVSPSRSNSMLPYRYQQILGIFKGNVIAVSVSGASDRANFTAQRIPLCCSAVRWCHAVCVE
jgi:hypothetical protein